MCARVIAGSYSSRDQEQYQEQRCHSAFIARFRFCCAVCCCCAPVSHRKLLTLWQSRCNSSRTPRYRYSFRGSYERCFCVCVCAYQAGVPFCTQRGSIPIRTSSQFQKHRRSTPAVHQQQRYDTSEPRNAHIHRNDCVSPFRLATPPGFQGSSKANAEGEPCTAVYDVHTGYDTINTAVIR